MDSNSFLLWRTDPYLGWPALAVHIHHCVKLFRIYILHISTRWRNTAAKSTTSSRVITKLQPGEDTLALERPATGRAPQQIPPLPIHSPPHFQPSPSYRRHWYWHWLSSRLVSFFFSFFYFSGSFFIYLFIYFFISSFLIPLCHIPKSLLPLSKLPFKIPLRFQT